MPHSVDEEWYIAIHHLNDINGHESQYVLNVLKLKHQSDQPLLTSSLVCSVNDLPVVHSHFLTTLKVRPSAL